MTATIHRWLVGIAAAFTVLAGGWSAIDTEPLGIPEGVGPAIAAIAGLLTLAVNMFRSATDPQKST